jgi:nitroreductase
MEIRDVIRTNGTVRRFTNDAVPRSTVVDILDDARFAPSGGNRQPWHVAVVEDLEIRRAMVDLMRPIWDEYLESAMVGGTPFNVVDYAVPANISANRPNDLFAHIDTIPVVLAVAADLRDIAMMDADIDRPTMTGGASIYPFCWNVLLSARAHGLGGVLTTFLSKAEQAAGPLLGLPEHHALVATIFLGVPEHQPTKLKRNPVDTFATLDRFDGPALGT